MNIRSTQQLQYLSGLPVITIKWMANSTVFIDASVRCYSAYTFGLQGKSLKKLCSIV